jgi:hypothetical protein
MITSEVSGTTFVRPVSSWSLARLPGEIFSARRLRMNAEVVLDGLVLGESPRWHDGRLWVADWAAHELITLDADGARNRSPVIPQPGDARR